MSDRNEALQILLRVQPISGKVPAKTAPLLVSGTCKKFDVFQNVSKTLRSQNVSLRRHWSFNTESMWKTRTVGVNFSTELQSKNTFSGICLLEASHLVSTIF
jgi:hypothetical protein